jgi:hypothetical protein
MTDAHEAVQSLSPQEAFKIFKALFKDAPFMGTAILSENQEYTVSTGTHAGYEPLTETGDFAVIFFTGNYYHELGAIHHSHSLMAVRVDQTDQVQIPNTCEEVFTVDHDEQQWAVYEDPTKPGFPSNHLRDEKQRELTKCIVFLTPNDLRKVIESEIFHAQIDLDSLRKNMSVNNFDKVQKRLEQLKEFPDNLLTEDLRVLRSDPDRLHRVKEILQEAQGLLSPEALEAVLANMAAQGDHLQGGAG